MKKLLSKNRIANLKKLAQLPLEPATRQALIKSLVMAEKYRQYSRAKDKRTRQKPKKYLKSTDYLSSEQFAKILCYVVKKADSDRKRTQTLTRAILNEMLIIFAVETGLRPSEVVNVKLNNLPLYHGKLEIEVFDGKGNKDRTVGISKYLAGKLTGYVKKYHKGHGDNTWLFLSEQGSQLSYGSFSAKIKIIGKAVGIWMRSDGKSRLTPHKFRHTFATLLEDETGDIFFVQNQLGHDDPKTTGIYTLILNEKRKSAMNNYHKRVFRDYNAELFDNL